jgi:hypothetical protein
MIPSSRSSTPRLDLAGPRNVSSCRAPRTRMFIESRDGGVAPSPSFAQIIAGIVPILMKIIDKPMGVA